MPKLPTVSVICITYNQEAFIKRALDSFVAQKSSNYKLEIIIADDSSNDSTQTIVRDYAIKYPKLIKPILRTKNIGAWANILDAMKTVQGEYIALCEGDDYWIDNNKLQKQVDYLEKNSDYALCFHPVRVVYENNEKNDDIFPKQRSGFTLKNLLQDNFIQTNSVMYRRQNYDDLAPKVLPGDWYLHLYHAQFGKIGFLRDVMAVYRRHPGGMWWDFQEDPYIIWGKRGVDYMALYSELLKMYGTKAIYREIIEKAASDMYKRLLTVDEKYGSHKVIEATQVAPILGGYFIWQQNESIQEKNANIDRLMAELARANIERHSVQTSKSFVLGYTLLHPWKAPNRVAEMIKWSTDQIKHRHGSGVMTRTSRGGKN